MRWNHPSEWVWSERQMHEPLVTTEHFDAAQAVFRSGTARLGPAQKTEARPLRTQWLDAVCALCGRRMQGSRNNGQAYYRCKFPSQYAITQKQHAGIRSMKASILPGAR